MPIRARPQEPCDGALRTFREPFSMELQVALTLSEARFARQAQRHGSDGAQVRFARVPERGNGCAHYPFYFQRDIVLGNLCYLGMGASLMAQSWQRYVPTASRRGRVGGRR